MDHGGKAHLPNRASNPERVSTLSDQAPTEAAFTPYDEVHFAVYLALLKATAEGVGEPEICLSILGVNPSIEPDRANVTLDSHLTRARWLARSGVLLRG